MADYKNYVVNYSITANAESAVNTINSLAETVRKMSPEMDRLANSARTVTEAINQLNSVKNFTFKPTIDTAAFNNQLQAMLLSARTTATEIQNALYGALKGDVKSTAALRKGSQNFIGKTTEQLKKDLAGYQKDLDKITGRTINKKGQVVYQKGESFFARNDKEKLAGLERDKKFYQSQIKAIKAELKERADILKEQEKTTKGVTATQSKSQQAQKRAASNVAKITNVTPATIKAWKNAFGDAKSRSLTLHIKAVDEATAIINSIKDKLAALNSTPTFTITPALNQAAFSNVEKQLARLSALSNTIVKPFGSTTSEDKNNPAKTSFLSKDERKKLSEAKKQSGVYDTKMKTLQDRIKANQDKYDKNPTKGLKGAITRDTNALKNLTALKSEQDKIVTSLNNKAMASPVATPAAPPKPIAVDLIGNLTKLNTAGKTFEIAVNAKISAAQIQESVKSIKVPTLNVPVKLSWGKGDASKKEQLKKATSNIPPIKLALDTSAAITALDEFIAKIKSKSPQNIKVNATPVDKTAATNKMAATTTTPTNVTAVTTKKTTGKSSAKPMVVDVIGNIASITAGKTFEIAVNAKVSSAQVMEQLKSIKAPTITSYVKLAWEKGAIGKNQQLKSIQSNIPPVKLVLDVSGAMATLNEFIATIKSKSPQTIALNATATNAASGTTTAATTAATTTSATAKAGATTTSTTATKKTSGSSGESKAKKPSARGQSRASLRTQASNNLLPFVTSKSQMDALLENRKFFKRATKLTGIAPTMNTDVIPMLKYLRQVYSMMKDANAAIPVGLKNKIDELQKQASGRWTTGKQIAADKLARDNKFALDRSLASKAKQAEALRAKAYNSVLPFVKSKAEADMIMKNRKFFQRASVATGISPYEGMSDENMLKYLKGVSGQMRASNAAVPMQLQSAINELNTKRLIQMREDAKAAFSNPTPYEKQLAAAEKQRIAQEKASAKLNKASRTQQVSRLRAQAYNSMLPFASNASQAKELVKYRKFFRSASVASGITPTPDMSANTRLQYLNSVANQMQKASVAIPWQLQNAINSTQKAIDKLNVPKSTRAGGGGVRSAVEPQKPFYDRVRKFAYPFTGNTSFGARTPMAVDMAKGMGVMFAIGGAMSAVGSSFGQSVQYQNVMETTKAILKNSDDSYTPQAFANMERIVRNVGVSTKFSAPEVANAAKFLAMAGSNIETINNSIRPIADLALIGDLDLGETADKMTNIMKTFQIDPKDMRKAANIMTNTFTRSNTDLMMLAESAKYGGGVAQMYGYKDPNTFADTMALFGIMGNSGIQGSAAGTALRMIYRNIFSPNKNQAAVLKYLEEKGIKTRNEDKSYRSLSEILIDMANNIPRDQMADVIGKLFRITAQPGANAVLTSAVNEEGVDAGEVEKGLEAIAQFADKKGLSELAKLMQSNRDSANGTISIDTAKAKQNTINGLWAQVTSTFTEGILKAFEKNTGYFEEQLKSLRDKLASPKTAETIKNLFDLLIKVGEVMAKFVGYWVKLYEIFPGLIKKWIVFQMVMTQLGTLMTPFVGLISVFSRLNQIITMITGAQTAAGLTATAKAVTAVRAASTANAVTSASGLAATGSVVAAATTMKANRIANGVLLAAPMLSSKTGSNLVNKRHAAYLAGQTKWEKAIMTGMAAYGVTGKAAKRDGTRALYARDNRIATAIANKQKYTDAVSGTSARTTEIRDRATRMYKWNNRFLRSYNASRALNLASFGVTFASLGKMFSNFMAKLGGALGLLANPITLAVSGIVALVLGLRSSYKNAKKNEEADKNALKEANDEAEKARKTRYEAALSLRNRYLNNSIVATTKYTNDSSVEQESKKSINYFDEYADLLKKMDTVAGAKESDKLWNNILSKNPNYRMAFGSDYNNHILGDFQENRNYAGKEYLRNLYSRNGKSVAQMYDSEIIKERAGIKKTDALVLAGAISDEAIAAQSQIIELRKQLLDGKIQKDEFYSRTQEIIRQATNPNAPGLFDATNFTLEDLKNRDWSYSVQYQQGILNVLMSERNKSIGSISGYLQAEYDLKKGLEEYSKDWYDAISKILILRTGMFEGVEYQLSMLPNGKLDFSSIVEQIAKTIKDFKGNLEQLATISSSVYSLLLKLGYVKGTSYTDFRDFVTEQVGDRELTKEDYSNYYRAIVTAMPTHSIARLGESKWIKEAMKGRDKKNWATRVRQWVISEAALKQQEEYERLNPQSNKTVKGANDVQQKATDTAGKQNANGTDASTNGGNGINGNKGDGTKTDNPNPTNQDDYASNYNNGVSKPTQIVINIDKLANFDRTTVAASAEEKELMASMESKIADAVYRIFAEAANRATQEIQIG